MTAKGNAGDAGGCRLEGHEVQRLRRREPQLRTVSREVPALQELLLRRVHNGNKLKTYRVTLNIFKQCLVIVVLPEPELIVDRPTPMMRYSIFEEEDAKEPLPRFPIFCW